ncbi:MAG: uracil-DNA glycosylase [Gammaproteobacteria bacterium]|nr:uracil-DNA glycosylase [Gammaproteobacteria bacterium]MBU1625693.1 uracil-DNA glycosylase [Gammaproteobacteria bacterium]MBU1980953.1 uracil-DNA glycosylase [Gammaproteobacteria bacterium]
MNVRDEQVLRELNLYPLWVRRGVPAQEELVPAPVASQAPAVRPEVQAAAPVAKAPLLADVPEVASIPGVASLDWPALKEKVRACEACKLRAGCTQTVFGVGDEQADWLFVGEGPGTEEDAQGEPFVGQAGKLLDNMLFSIGLKRGDNVYIANVVKCQPPNDRNPAADEIATCMPYLQQQIALIKPKLIIALGKTAATALLGRDAPLGSLRGTPHDYHGTPLLITYHPAYLLRSPGEKSKAWQDLKSAVSLMH